MVGIRDKTADAFKSLMSAGFSPAMKCKLEVMGNVNDTNLAFGSESLPESTVWWKSLILKAKDGVVSKYHTVKDNISDLRTRIRVGTIGSTLALNT